MFKINRKKTGSINDGGRRLKIGTHAYRIDGVELKPVKADPTGKEQQIVLNLTDLNDPSYSCLEYLSVMAKNDDARGIAERTLVAFFDAAGIEVEVISPQQLKKLKGSTVVITAVETKSKTDATKTYVNIRTVEAFDGEESEEESEEEPEEEEESEEEESEEEEEESEEEEEESEEEEEEAPPAKAKASKGKPAAKKRPW